MCSVMHVLEEQTLVKTSENWIMDSMLFLELLAEFLVSLTDVFIASFCMVLFLVSIYGVNLALL